MRTAQHVIESPPETDVPGPPRGMGFQIVPLRGLPIVGIVLAALVAAIATNELWAIDFFHVVSGGIWTALDLFLGFVIGPILGRRCPSPPGSSS